MNSNGNYEAFLSFRGTDTRQGFTDVLYNYMTMAEIRTFRDDNELAVGDKIDPSIFQAIEASNICIPVFSPNFAKSKWCLREVTKMVELKKTIVPVFYKVSPDDVKLKETSSIYNNDLRMFGDHLEINEWKNALPEAASHKGLLLGDTPYTTFCKKIVDEVLLRLGPRKRSSVDHFVGEDNKRAAMKLLDIGSSSEQVIYLVIHGMGGIGKTTLTEIIYNELMSSFQHCSFVPNIRQLCKSNGVEDLRPYLYRNFQPKIVEAYGNNRSEHLISVLNKKKVLIVLDDVDSWEQIEKAVKDASWFGSGSRILVTTRDQNVLKMLPHSIISQIRYLEMKELKDGWALELFSKCAFGTLSPPSKYKHLSERFVGYAGGLPLAIIVIAKYLRNTTEGVWEEILERSKRNPLREVKDKLLLSYDSLDEDQKTIFLDIACLFVDSVYTETSNLFYMWEACGLYPRTSLEVLQSRSLVRLNQKNELMMHDQLRDLGRDIAKSKTNPTKQSRLWEKEDVLEVLKCKEKEKKENIEALRLPSSYEGKSFKLRKFSDLGKLRFLELRPKLNGILSGYLPQLKWLSSRHVFKVGKLVLPNLVILELSGCEVNEKSDGWKQIQQLGKLKVLDLSWCRNLERTPAFAKTMVLERLDLSSCSRLSCVDPSIADLHQLDYLSLQNCTSLLQLPENLGNLKNLTKLDLEGTGITTLPDSITNLTKLWNLNLRSARSLSHLPHSLGNLHSLVDLNVSSTKITALPYSIGDLKNLERLHLKRCRNLATLPTSLGKLQSLQFLDLRNSGITALPESTGDLKKLKYLRLSGSEIKELPRSINHLPLLQTLNLERCNGLHELPQLSANLKELKIRSFVLNKIHNLSNLQHLVSLEIEIVHKSSTSSTTFDWDGSFPNNLQSLSLKNLAVTKIPDMSGLSKLVTLLIQSCKNLGNVSGLGKLQCLSYLCIRECSSLKSLEELVELQALSEFMLINCKKLTEIPGLGELRGLTKARFEDCESLEKLDDLAKLGRLRKLSIIGCVKLNGIIHIEQVQSLTSVHIQNCPAANLASLERLGNLKSLNLINCEQIKELVGLSELKHLTVLRAFYSLENIEGDLGELTELKHLTLAGCRKLTRIPGIGNLGGLVSLYVNNCGSFASLESIGKLTNLRKLHLIGCHPGLTEIPGRDELPHLKNVKLTYKKMM